jgi:hypothetical protein
LVGTVLNHKDQKTTAGYAYFQTKERHRVLDKHGKNVVSFAVQRSAPTSPLSNVSAEKGSAGGPPPPVHRFDRKSLYELVWSESILKIAKRLGVSDVGLAKACRKAAIPTPDRGYWAKFYVGTPSVKPPLPPLPADVPDAITLRARPQGSQFIAQPAKAALA